MLVMASTISPPSVPKNAVNARPTSGSFDAASFAIVEMDFASCFASPSKPFSSKAVFSLPSSFVPACTKSRRAGVTPLDKAILNPSEADFKSVMSPAKLSSWVSAIRLAEPCAPFNAALNPSTVDLEETVILLNACKPNVEKMAFLVTFFSSSDIPAIADCKSSMTSFKGRAFPVASYALTFSLSSAFFAVEVGVYKSIMALFNAVDASAPVTFCSANRSKARVVPSAVCPYEAAVAAESLKAVPNWFTLVLAFAAPVAIMSVYLDALSKLSPKPFTAPVTYLADVAKSNPPDAAKSKTSGNAAICSDALKPLWARMFKPSAACCAEKAVVAPISCAKADRLPIWSTVVPIVAATCDMDLSKFMPVFTVSFMKSMPDFVTLTTAAPIAAHAATPNAVILLKPPDAMLSDWATSFENWELSPEIL